MREVVISRVEDTVVRLAHFSDIHVTTRKCAWTLRDRFNKRLSAWVNLRLLGRGFRFRDGEKVLAALSRDLRGRDHNAIVFTGDATALGFREELARTSGILNLDDPNLLPGLAVPGNHDYCTLASMRSGHFETTFAPWLQGQRIDNATYPFARRIGPVWLIGVNSAIANRWPWDARGAVGPAQLNRLKRLLQQLEDGIKILVTHYPIRVANGRPESPVRALRDLDELLQVARSGKINLWLHGHRHNSYLHEATSDVPFPVICAGSATQNRLWSYNEYTITGESLAGNQRIYDPAIDTFVDEGQFSLRLKPTQSDSFNSG